MNEQEAARTLKAILDTLERIADTLDRVDNSLAFLEQGAAAGVTAGGFTNEERW